MVEITSLGASANFFQRLISGLEFTSYAKDSDLHDYRRGGVISLENKLRFWREYYATLDVARANTTLALLPGSTIQVKAGLKMFHLAGLESSVTYDIDRETNNGEKDSPENTHNTSHITGQFHVYF